MVKFTHGNTCGMIYCNDLDWTSFHPMKSKADAHHSLATLFSRNGIPDTLIVGGAGELTGDEFKKKARDTDSHVKVAEPYSAWSNRAESAVRENKCATRRVMKKSKKCPKHLYIYGTTVLFSRR